MNTRIKAVAAAFALAGAIGVQAAPVPVQGTWETTLQARDLNGDTVTDAYYDTALNITWLAVLMGNENRMTWSQANTWAGDLVVGAYSDWRLPSTTPGGDGSCNFGFSATNCGFNVDPNTSELAHLYHVTLGNLSEVDTSGTTRAGSGGVDFGLANTGPFTTLFGDYYWSGTAYAPSPSDSAWYFQTNQGVQQVAGQLQQAPLALAVRPGDVATAAIPEPQTYLLMLCGIAAPLAVRRRHC